MKTVGVSGGSIYIYIYIYLYLFLYIYIYLFIFYLSMCTHIYIYIFSGNLCLLHGQRQLELAKQTEVPPLPRQPCRRFPGQPAVFSRRVCAPCGSRWAAVSAKSQKLKGATINLLWGLCFYHQAACILETTKPDEQ